jgi:oligosaccharide repeat unit polymerase
MIEKIILSIGYLLATALTCLLFRRFRAGSPVFWHPLALALMALGTIVLIDPQNPVDLFYVGLHFLALTCFVAASAAHLSFVQGAERLTEFSRRGHVTSSKPLRLFVFFVLLVSVAITIAYYIAVGYNMAVLILFGGGVEDYSTMRLYSYSGANYFAPGYVNQFKNVLLPISTVAIIYWLKSARRPVELVIFSSVSVPFLIYALAGTGQRGYLFYTGASVLLSFVLHNIGGKFRILSARIVAIALPVVVLFGLMTISYNKLGDQGAGKVVEEIILRFTTVQQEGALAGFHYIHTLPIAWFAEWGKSFAGVLPGVEGSTLSHEIHAVMYGTARGTVPLSTIGSAYHNGGVVGVVLLFLLLGFAYAKLYTMYLSGEREIVRSLTFGFLFFYLIIYLADSPAALMDSGVVTALLFLGLINLFRDKKSANAYKAPSAAVTLGARMVRGDGRSPSQRTP